MIDDAVPPLSVAIMAGGQSKRLGTDKALVRLAAGDPPLLRMIADRLSALTDDCFAVSRARPEYEELGVRVLPDLYGDDAGVLGGIGSAIRHARYDACFVVSCDNPFLSLTVARGMAAMPRAYDALVPRVAGESRQGGRFVWQTLQAIYRRTCLTAIEHALDTGQRQVISFFADVQVSPVDEAWIRGLDPDLLTFLSVNTPEALQIAREIRLGRTL